MKVTIMEQQLLIDEVLQLQANIDALLARARQAHQPLMTKQEAQFTATVLRHVAESISANADRIEE